MDKYLKQKIPTLDLEEKAQKQADFVEKLKQLKNAPVEMNSNLGQKVVKDLPVDRINTIGEPIKLKDSAEMMANQIISTADRNAARQKAVESAADVLDYNKLRKESADMNARKVYGKASGVDLDYNQLRKSMKSGGKKVLGAIPLLGAGYAALSGEPAMAAEELVSDASDLAGPLAAKLGAGAAAGPIGLAAMGAQQALQSSGAGMSPEDEKLMLAEIQAKKDYDASPARLARLNAIKSIK